METDAVVHPRAVVIHLHDAAAANTAVVRTVGLHKNATVAVADWTRHCSGSLNHIVLNSISNQINLADEKYRNFMNSKDKFNCHKIPILTYIWIGSTGFDIIHTGKKRKRKISIILIKLLLFGVSLLCKNVHDKKYVIFNNGANSVVPNHS